MATKERSFWSGIPGLLTGLAGVLTAVVGLLGLALSQGWIGDGTAEENLAGDGGVTEVVRISVKPEDVSLTQPGRAAVTVTVTNGGNQPVSVTTEVTGEGRDSFKIDNSECAGGPIAPGRTCPINVELDAGVGQHDARLVVSAEGGKDNAEVALSGTSVRIIG